MQRLNIRLSAQEYEDLVKLAKLRERSMNDLAREAIRRHVDAQRDTAGFNLCVPFIPRFKTGGSQVL
jgi:predicted DNA-binding protein